MISSRLVVACMRFVTDCSDLEKLSFSARLSCATGLFSSTELMTVQFLIWHLHQVASAQPRLRALHAHNSKIWLFSSMRGAYSPAHSMISCIVSSTSPGFRWVM